MSRARAKRPAKKAAHVHRFRERIDAERRRLQKASAVLLAMIYSLDRGLESEQAGDAASVALDLIERAVVALDSVTLTGGIGGRCQPPK